MEKSSIVGGWYKESKVKEFCVFDNTVMACFKTFFFKTYFAENKVKVHVFKVPVFVASLTEPLSFCVLDYYRKIKESSHSL